MATATPFTFYHLVFNNLLVEFKALRLTHGVMHHQNSVTEKQHDFICLWLFHVPLLNEEQELLKWLQFKMWMQVNTCKIQIVISNKRRKKSVKKAG